MAAVEEKIRLLEKLEKEKGSGKYLPLTENARKVFPKADYGTEWYDDPQYNLGWDVGILAGNRPYFMEHWATCGITMLTYFIPAAGLEDAAAKDLARMLEAAKLFRFTDPEHIRAQAMKFTEDDGNEFWSVNICLGDEEGTYVSGAASFPLSRLNEYNRKKRKETKGNEH